MGCRLGLGIDSRSHYLQWKSLLKNVCWSCGQVVQIDSGLNGHHIDSNQLENKFIFTSVSRSGDLLDFWQPFEAFGNN